MTEAGRAGPEGKPFLEKQEAGHVQARSGFGNGKHAGWHGDLRHRVRIFIQPVVSQRVDILMDFGRPDRGRHAHAASRGGTANGRVPEKES